MSCASRCCPWILVAAVTGALPGQQPAGEGWWSLQPLAPVALPAASAGTNPIDAFLDARRAARGLRRSPPADRRTLARRLWFDLIGLPPDFEEVEAFVHDPDPAAYERLVDRLLASPRHGERQARHWLDVVHYADTHGYDKDQPRPNAWPYRDWVVEAFHQDMPHARFVAAQIAGDVLGENSGDVRALGFLAAGPWDLIGHAEVPESKIDGKIARHLDRDDMVATTMTAFCSLTVHCAQCHDHKFDPVPQTDYYRLQAVFSALDRADRPFDADADIARRRGELQTRQRQLQSGLAAIERRTREAAGQELDDLDRRIADGERTAKARPEYGFHSAIASGDEAGKWVQVDLGTDVAVHAIALAPCHDDFHGIGAGFGFPPGLRVDLLAADASIVHSISPPAGPVRDVELRTFPVPGRAARRVRVTATRLAPRQDDHVFALAELLVFDAAGANVARGRPVEALDSIEAPPRWRTANLVDGIYPAMDTDLSLLRARRRELLLRHTDAVAQDEHRDLTARLVTAQQELAALPPLRLVYAATVHHGSGAFAGTGANGGRPRPIHVLQRGEVTRPGPEVGPGALSALAFLPSAFDLPPDAPESERRAALARWLCEPTNPLIWRSVVNRIWAWHFGRGLVDTANDFGRMGQPPSHPELLDWLARWFRDQGGSWRQLHRLIVTSAAWRQSSNHDAHAASIDADNVLLWRMPRKKLEAEAVRDSLLAAAGRLDLRVGGPGFQDFVISRPEHSPHYEYDRADPDDPATHRRSIWRFVVRSQQQPFLAALDCADPSLLVDKRNQSQTPLQALALRNDGLALTMSRHLAERVASAVGAVRDQVALAVRFALGRSASAAELDLLTAHAEAHGLPSTCRLLFNLAEFSFVD